MHPNRNARIFASVCPLIYGLILRFVFKLNLLDNHSSVMSLSFLLFVPFVMGYITICLSDEALIRRWWYRVFMPWMPNIGFLIVTLLVQLEGWGCWFMALPIFLIISSLGGLVAGLFLLRSIKRREQREQQDNFLQDQDNTLKVSAVILILPLLSIPVERLVHFPVSTSRAYTYIDIKAPAKTIWDHVTRVQTITHEEDRSRLTKWMRFPRPVRAELDTAAVGGSRQAIFTGGLVFTEVVTQYRPLQSMQFSIRANPYYIPSTTMDEHIVIGGEFFDVLDGNYRLESISDSACRLHLYSDFTMSTHFNFYADIWAGWIMKDIQNNILQVIRTRCEPKML